MGVLVLELVLPDLVARRRARYRERHACDIDALNAPLALRIVGIAHKWSCGLRVVFDMHVMSVGRILRIAPRWRRVVDIRQIGSNRAIDAIPAVGHIVDGRTVSIELSYEVPPKWAVANAGAGRVDTRLRRRTLELQRRRVRRLDE